MSTGPANPLIAATLLVPAVTLTALNGKAANGSTIWTNNFNYPIFIYRGFVWCGVSKDNFGDVSFMLADPRYIYLPTNDDHYENRGGIPMNSMPFDASPAYFQLNPGENLTLALAVNCDVPPTAELPNPALTAQAFAFVCYVQ
jgi:hypothetical protein